MVGHVASSIAGRSEAGILLVHADWSLRPAKRVMARALCRPTGDSAPEIAAPEPVGDLQNLLPRLIRAAGGRPVLLGVDFPLGVPAIYAKKTGVEDFAVLLPRLGRGIWEAFFEPAEHPGQIDLHRPFFPARPGGARRARLVEGLGLNGFHELYRDCDRATAGRPAGAPLFWTMGARQVGKAAIVGWRDLLGPAMRGGAPLRLWPFHGSLADLLEPGVVVVGESYPAEACLHLGFAPPGQGWSKSTVEGRKRVAPAFEAWAARTQVRLDPALRRELRAGFPSGDDGLDAVLGLGSLLEVVRGRRGEGYPAEERLRRIEGWILGMEAVYSGQGPKPATGG